MKVLFGLALRQTTGLVECLLRLSGPDWLAPDFSTLSRRQKALNVDIPYRGSQRPLHLLVDSTGMEVKGEDEWKARTHGGSKRRVWRKVHLGIDEKTLETRAVHCRRVIARQSLRGSSPAATSEILPCCRDFLTGSRLSGKPEASLQTAPTIRASTTMPSTARQRMSTCTRGANEGANAVVPPRKNANPRKPDTAGAIAGNEAPRPSKHLGRAHGQRWSGYHRRSRAEPEPLGIMLRMTLSVDGCTA